MMRFLIFAFAVLCCFSHVSSAEPPPSDPSIIQPVAAMPDSGIVSMAPTAANAPAEAVVPEPDVDTLKQIVIDVRSGQWRLAAAGVLLVAMFLVSKARQKTKWFRGDRGGAIALGLLAFLGAVASALKSGANLLDLKLFVGTLGVMWTAAGGYNWFKRIIWPSDAAADPAPNQ